MGGMQLGGALGQREGHTLVVGDRPVPRKYVITSKAVGAAPQYTLRLREWKTGVSPTPDAFAFKPPGGSSGVAITLLKDIDEIPAGVVPGGGK